jgi:hypothetical protein
VSLNLPHVRMCTQGRTGMFPCSLKSSLISVSSEPIYYPNQLWVEVFAGSPLFRLDVRVLKLYGPVIIGLHVCDVSLTIFGKVDNLLPINRKLTFPIAVPICFILPLRIAMATSPMSPVQTRTSPHLATMEFPQPGHSPERLDWGSWRFPCKRANFTFGSRL